MSKLDEKLARVDDKTVPTSGAQLRHYRAAVALYEGKLRAKYGRTDFWRVYLRSEADQLSSLRKALLIKQTFIREFYTVARKFDEMRDAAWADALLGL